jgi:catechol 2,3-dioxygenase-like lactoylglutathione lyase family enzyme
VTLGSAAVIAFVGVADLEQARGFYGGTLGLELTDESPFALGPAADGRMLRITAVGEPVRAPYTVVGWSVPDIVSAVDDLVARGIGFTRVDGVDQDERGIWWPAPGMGIAWFADPDGNGLSLTQFA